MINSPQIKINKEQEQQKENKAKTITTNQDLHDLKLSETEFEEILDLYNIFIDHAIKTGVKL